MLRNLKEQKYYLKNVRQVSKGGINAEYKYNVWVNVLVLTFQH